MSPRTRYACAALLCVLTAVCSIASAQSELRNARVGDKIEPFTLIDMDSSEFQYQHRPGRVSILAFLAARQKRSDRALDDLLTVVADMRRLQHPVDLVVIITGGEGIDYFREKQDERLRDVPMLIDANDALWGRMGIVVTPTTIMIDREGTVRWIRAGHGFDFATDAQARLKLALDLGSASVGDDAEPVHALTNDSAKDRARRHLRMGRILARKGEVESAISEFQNAVALTPGAADVQLELTSMLCRAGRGDDALAAAERITPVTRAEHARLTMVRGWAHRQLGDLDEAVTLLTKSIELDPGSARALYELGKTYEQRGENQSALNAYRRALAAHYDEPVELPSRPASSDRTLSDANGQEKDS